MKTTKSSLNLERYLASKRKIVEKALNDNLVLKEPLELYQAMRYSVFSDGKRLRPILVLAGAEICGFEEKKVLDAACAIEYIHTYSLIHDDLPALDNDDYRRGKLTCHKKFSEDLAILAGDALLTYAFELLGRNIKRCRTKNGGRAVELLAQAVGKDGMVGGQTADIIYSGGEKKSRASQISDVVDFIHLNKTAKLIEISCKLGAVILNASESKLRALGSYGRNIGLAFQIVDDLLDYGEKNSDRINRRLTYPGAFGVDASRKKAKEYVESAKRVLRGFSNASPLILLADYVIERNK